MMKCCCLIVFIFCTIDVTNGGILSRICLASNGTCGQKGVTCNETFGPEWTYNGKCCNKRPCCKFLKAPCVPESCPHGYKLLSNQASSADCYFHGNSLTHWDAAQSSCASTRGAYLWRPNTKQETNDVRNTIAGGSFEFWTGANDRDKDGKFTFIIENGSFSLNSVPFGSGSFNRYPDAVHVAIALDVVTSTWIWLTRPSTQFFDYICEYQRVSFEKSNRGLQMSCYFNTWNFPYAVVFASQYFSTWKYLVKNTLTKKRISQYINW